MNAPTTVEITENDRQNTVGINTYAHTAQLLRNRKKYSARPPMVLRRFYVQNKRRVVCVCKRCTAKSAALVVLPFGTQAFLFPNIMYTSKQNVLPTYV